jgi:hypothetical protein
MSGMDEQAKITRIFQPVTIELNGAPWEGNIKAIHRSHDGKTASVDLMSRDEFQKMVKSVMIDPDEFIRG